MSRFSPQTVANALIEKGVSHGKPLTPMQLVKLVYITHGWYLAFTGKPLVNEPIQAWKYGPVVSSIYHSYKWYGGSPITDSIGNVAEADQLRWNNVKNIRPFIDSIWKRYGHLSGVQLSTITHEKGSPWYTVWELQGGKNKHGATIPDSLIRGHYTNKLLESQNTEFNQNV